MPSKRAPRPQGTIRPGDQNSSFRRRFDALEEKREALLRRLERAQISHQSHPAIKRALTLLNQTFRKSSLVKRVAVLQAADWLIQVIEMSLPIL